MAKIQEMATVLEQTILAESVYSMWLATNVAKEAAAGQFVSLYCGEGSRLLPRPISICQIDTDRNAIRLVYRLAGKGTKEFSKLQTDEQVRILGPLGNGFPLEGQHRWRYRRTSDVRISKTIKTGFNNHSGLSG